MLGSTCTVSLHPLQLTQDCQSATSQPNKNESLPRKGYPNNSFPQVPSDMIQQQCLNPRPALAKFEFLWNRKACWKHAGTLKWCTLMHLEPSFGPITPKAKGAGLFQDQPEAYPQPAQSKALETSIVWLLFQEIKCSNLAGPERREWGSQSSSDMVKPASSMKGCSCSLAAATNMA